MQAPMAAYDLIRLPYLVEVESSDHGREKVSRGECNMVNITDKDAIIVDQRSVASPVQPARNML
jgi:hypothetical protein